MTTWTSENSDLLRYREEIRAGRIIAGQELRQELDNLAEDIVSGAYRYDTRAARLRIDFIQGACRLTKSPFYGQPMQLLLWQRAFIEALYSFKKPDGRDRFRRALLLVARKNGKSEVCSALSNAEFICGPDGADLVCSSNDDAQASIIYDAIDTMRQMYDPQDQDTKRNQRFILNRASSTRIFKISDRTRNKEGRNIDFAILDEVHEMQTNTIAKSIEQSQSLKPSPKLIEITTEGFVIDGYLDAELKRARDIIAGRADGPADAEFLPWLYTQDSEQEVFTNPASWIKSNPTLGVIKPRAYLEAQVDLAKKSKADRIFVLSKDFNIKQNGSEAWLNATDYIYDATFDPEELRGAVILGHVDLAETTDLCCAMALAMRPGDPKKYILSRYFVPASKLEPENDDHQAGAKYAEWAREGLLEVTEGNDIDLTLVADWFAYLRKAYGLRLYRCGYDQRFARDWITQMEGYGWTRSDGDLEMVQQNAPTLNNAILLTEADFRARLINYNANPITRWCLSNACLKLNDQRQALIIKTENAKKIDGAVALASLYEIYRRYRSDLRKMTGG